MSDLAWAVKNGDLDQVKEMVDVKVGGSSQSVLINTRVSFQGVDINQQIDGRLPLHYASDYGQLEVIKFLCSKVSKLKLFIVFYKEENCCSQGAQLNSEDKHGISPLLAAIWEGHTSCVQFLLEKVTILSIYPIKKQIKYK